MNPMNAVAESPVAKPARNRSPRKPGDQSTRLAPARLAKSKDAGKTKVSFYLDAPVAAKLAVSAIIRQSDQSDVANEILRQALSSVTFYDKPSPKVACDNVEDRQDGAAA